MNKQQSYDSSLKALLQEDAARILPHLLQGIVGEATFIEALDVEVLPPARRSDRVFLFKVEQQRFILDIEFESSADSTIAARLHAYAAYLHLKHGIPVLSMVVYPFEVSMPKPPLEWKISALKTLDFQYEVVALWKMHAHQYVQQHAIEMYALIPTMQGITVELLAQALEEMRQAYQYDEAKLARQLLWMGILLRRSSTIETEAKQDIRRRLNMFDKLLEEDERVIELMEEREARGEARGRIEGKAELVTTLIEVRFPTLAEEVHRKIPRIQRSEDLDRIAELIVTAPDENALRWVLNTMVA